MYRGGRPKEICPDCKSWKKKYNQVFSAYGTQCFYGIELPDPWRLTKNGSGNIARWLSGQFITLYDHHGLFGLVINPRGGEKGVFRRSDVVAAPQDVPQGITWAEGVVNAVVRSYSAR